MLLLLDDGTNSSHSQVVDYYKEACRALENPETASLLGRIQKDWKKLVQMKIYYFAAVAHVRQGLLVVNWARRLEVRSNKS